MRINLANPPISTQSKLVKHVAQWFATEFCTNGLSVYNHLKSGDPHVGEYVTKWLQTQGWKVTWYNVPVPSGTYSPNDFTHFTPLSFGFVFEEDCDLLIKWQLSHT